LLLYCRGNAHTDNTLTDANYELPSCTRNEVDDQTYNMLDNDYLQPTLDIDTIYDTIDC